MKFSRHQFDDWFERNGTRVKVVGSGCIASVVWMLARRSRFIYKFPNASSIPVGKETKLKGRINWIDFVNDSILIEHLPLSQRLFGFGRGKGSSIRVKLYGIKVKPEALQFIKSNLIYSRCILYPFSRESDCIVGDVKINREALAWSPLLTALPLWYQNAYYHATRRRKISLARILSYRGLASVDTTFDDLAIKTPRQMKLITELKETKRIQQRRANYAKYYESIRKKTSLITNTLCIACKNGVKGVKWLTSFISRIYQK